MITLSMDNLPITEHDDGELRCRDLDLAERLGYANPVKIRELIRRHIKTLSQFGVIPTVGITAGAKGGRPGREFHLNRKQAIYLTTQSGTAEAAAMTLFIVEVFDKYLMGKLIAVDVDTVRELEAAHKWDPPAGGEPKWIFPCQTVAVRGFDGRVNCPAP